MRANREAGIIQLIQCDHVPYDVCNLYGVADIHVGAKEFDEGRFRQDIKAIIADPTARVIIPGDILDYTIATSVGDAMEQTMPVDEQEEYALDLLSPIAKKILVMLSGNHERRTKEHNVAIKRMAKRLGVEYEGDDAVLKIPVGKKSNAKPAVYIVYTTHGWSGGRTIGSTANMLDVCATKILSDVYVTGHAHRREYHYDQFMIPDCQNGIVREVMRHFVALGSYQGHSPFGRRSGFKAQPCGASVIHLSGKEKRVTVTL